MNVNDIIENYDKLNTHDKEELIKMINILLSAHKRQESKIMSMNAELKYYSRHLKKIRESIDKVITMRNDSNNNWGKKLMSPLESETPPYQKQIMFRDIVKHANKYNKSLEQELLKNGINPLEINWFKQYYPEEFKMITDKDKDEKIKELQHKIIDLRNEIELLQRYNKQKNVQSNKLTIKEEGENFIVIEHRQGNNNKKYISGHTIPKSNVRIIRGLIDILIKEKDYTTYREIVKALIDIYGFDVTVDSFNGGKNRQKYLFSYYYYPIKILQHQLYINYSKKGKVTKLK